MWSVMIPGWSPLLTTIAPMIALPITSAKQNHDSPTTHHLKRLALKDRNANSKVENPSGRDVKRLRNSIHVCTGSKLANTVSRVIVSGSIPFLAACRLNFAMSSFDTSIWSALVGGIRHPQHVGQSGHPKPEPVTRTVAPTTTSKMSENSAIQASRLTIMEFVGGDRWTGVGLSWPKASFFSSHVKLCRGIARLLHRNIAYIWMGRPVIVRQRIFCLGNLRKLASPEHDELAIRLGLR